jgi:polysaccharide export outer membrane protein
MSMILLGGVARSLRWRAVLLPVVGAALLAGCTTLPTSGPTGIDLRSQLKDDTSRYGITLVEVKSLADVPTTGAQAPVFGRAYVPPPPTELVGPGDTLDIAIYESGIALFGRSVAASPAGDPNYEASAKAERLPPARVSDEGTINIPFVGEMTVKGRTTSAIEAQIRKALLGKSQNPQVLVSIREGLTNSVIIGGDVARPGRLVLPTNRESLSDVIALAGGNRGEIKDMLVRVERSGVSGEFRLSDVLSNPEQNIRIFPADRISVVKATRSFSVLGAAGKAEQIAFPAPQVSLAEALAASGGSNPNSGDARAIFVFRNTRDEAGKPQSTVFHLNMMNASAYPLAQRFPMEDKDVLYIGNAAANQPAKFMQIISQLFFPIAVLQGF